MDGKTFKNNQAVGMPGRVQTFFMPVEGSWLAETARKKIMTQTLMEILIK